ncbi:tyrosine-type recombinase/integrase [Hydrogenophaga sp.]|uniref:tyrosine-type recombinase/integrase n=1 Tax=Hydrogenophaga sp. TaxID=1904254 RepID=UPI002FC58FBA
MNIYKQTYKVKDAATGQMVTKESDNWYYRFNRYNQTYTGSTRTGNLTKAQQFVHRKLREVDDERDTLIANGGKKRITIENAFQTYLDSQAKAGQLKNIETRLNKMLGHKLSKKKEGVVIFGFERARTLCSLSDADVQQLVIHRRKEGSSNGTILAELSALAQTISLIKKLGFLIPEIDFAAIKKDSKVKTAKGKLRYLDATEEAALLHQLHPDTPVRGCGSDMHRMQRQDAHDLAILLLDFGGRYGELATLAWKQVDLKNKVIHLFRSKVDNESILHMTNRVFEVLTRRRENTLSNVKYVFQAEDGTARKYSPKAFRSAIKRAGIEGATIHTIRHTFASKLVQAGVSLQELQDLLGHASVTTSAIYAHLVPNQAAARAAAILNGADA